MQWNQNYDINDLGIGNLTSVVHGCWHDMSKIMNKNDRKVYNRNVITVEI